MQIISYDSPRGGVSVITEKGDITASFLVVQHAKPSDSGTYSCTPSLGETVSVNVHVLRGSVLILKLTFVTDLVPSSSSSVYRRIYCTFGHQLQCQRDGIRDPGFIDALCQLS